MVYNLLSWILFPLLFSPSLPPFAPTERWNIQTIATSSDEVMVQTGTNATSTTVVLHAPYGVKSEVVTEHGAIYATTTPLTEADVKEMEQRQIQFQKQLDRLFQEQEKVGSLYRIFLYPNPGT